MKPNPFSIAFLAFAGSMIVGCDDSSSNNMLATSTGTWMVYADPYGNGNPNPAMGITGSAEAVANGAGMRLSLTVSTLPPNRAFGSHLHKLACDNMKAGGHYQDMPFPTGSNANDPMFANATNEAWLDFTTDAMGKAQSQSTVS